MIRDGRMTPRRQRAPASGAWSILFAVLAGFPLACPVHAVQADAGSSVSLDQLMTALGAVRHVEARYTERRTLRALTTPIETHGTLRFDAPDHLEKAADPGADGAPDRLAIDGNRLTIDRGDGKPPVLLMLNEHPEIGVLVESLRATLSGDAAALRRSFDISLAGTIDHWQIVLQPHDSAQRQVLQWMRITGYAQRITAINSQDGDGDHAEMTIQEKGR